MQGPRNIYRNSGTLLAFRFKERGSSFGSWATVCTLQKVPFPEVVRINGPATIRVELMMSLTGQTQASATHCYSTCTAFIQTESKQAIAVIASILGIPVDVV